VAGHSNHNHTWEEKGEHYLEKFESLAESAISVSAWKKGLGAIGSTLCCSGLQWVAVSCSLLQRVAACCSQPFWKCLEEKAWRSRLRCALQSVAVCCSLLQSVAVCSQCERLEKEARLDKSHSLLQSVPVCCSLLQSVVLIYL